MRDLLQTVIDGLNELRAQMGLNEGRPSADMISAKLLLFESMLTDHRALAEQQAEPPAPPQPIYEPDTPIAIDAIVDEHAPVDETPIAAADADAAFADAAPDAR